MDKKIWINHNGQQVPAKYVTKDVKEREKLVMKHVNKAHKINETMKAYKAELLAECDAFYNEMLKQNKVKIDGKGNYSFTTFDKEYKIEIKVQERIEFDDFIQVAHAKIKEYLNEITQGANTDIIQIVNTAFQTNKGRMDVKRVLGLFELKITHKLWLEAMELIKKSISRNMSKRYPRIWHKNQMGEYDAIELNFSAI